MKTLIAITVLLLAQVSMAQDAGNRQDVLARRATEAYEMKAESKVGEFFSYLELLTDPAANAEMKAQTAAEAAKLYQNDVVTVQNVFDKNDNIATVKKLLELAMAQKGKVAFSITSFSIMPRGETDKRRDWMMTYELIIGKKMVRVSQGFSMILEGKKFGNTTKQVWNSYLGEMRVIK